MFYLLTSPDLRLSTESRGILRIFYCSLFRPEIAAFKYWRLRE
jgi:hypothetical protein